MHQNLRPQAVPSFQFQTVLQSPSGLSRVTFKFYGCKCYQKRHSRDNIHYDEWGYDGESTITHATANTRIAALRLDGWK